VRHHGGVGERRLIFGEAPEQYHRHRPGYPPDLIDQVVGHAGAGGRVLDVGAGTGKLTADLLGHGLVVAALEPSPGMAAVLRRTIGSDPAANVLEVGFEDLPTPPVPFDVLVAGQSWHWLRPGDRLDVAARVLCANGHLVLAWNREEHPGPVGDAIVAAYEAEAPELAGIDDSTWLDPIVTELDADERFGPVAVSELAWPLTRTRDDYLAVLATYSGHRLLPPETRVKLFAAIGAAIDADGGAIALDGRTAVITATRR